MTFLRYFLGFPLAVLVTSALFLLMYHLIRSDELPEVKTDGDVVTINFKPKKKLPPDDNEEITIIEVEKPPVPPTRPAETFKPDPPTGGTVGPDPVTPDPGGTKIVTAGGVYPVLTMAPSYPSSCQSRGVEGEATVVFDITNGGEVVNARVVSSTDRCFEQAALRAIRNWKYSTALNADPAGIRVRDQRVTFDFEIEE